MGWPEYHVSRMGDVRRASTMRALKPWAQRNGYMRVNLCRRGVARTYMVHRLVATAFKGGAPTERHQVDHINGRKSDNAAANLRWVTPRENRRSGQIARGSKVGTSVLIERDVRELRALYDKGQATVNEIAEKFGVSRTTVTKIGRRRAWTHI